MSVEREYADVLQNIETGIVTVYEEDSSLLDLEVLDAIDALIRVYVCEEQGRGAGKMRLTDRSQRVYEAARRMCEWRIGRGPLNQGEAEAEDSKPTPISVSEIVLCLKRIRKSVRLWYEHGGRQGYLDYVQQFLSEARRAPDARQPGLLE
jgi:hypothetical protein